MHSYTHINRYPLLLEYKIKKGTPWLIENAGGETAVFA